MRTEIVASITVLLAAALFFSGFLLLKVAERELVTQTTGSVAATMDIVARSLSTGLDSGHPTDAMFVQRAAILFDNLPESLHIDGWAAVDRELVPVHFSSPKGIYDLEKNSLPQVKYDPRPSVNLHYPEPLSLLFPKSESFVVVTVPVLADGEFVGALQARFAITEVRQRVASVQKVMLFNAFICGSVLVCFGVYLLNWSVVRPIRRLQWSTCKVAGGDLEQSVPVSGPREIADLAGSFNAMIAALRQSHQDSENHIHSLQRANEELQETRDDLVRSEKMASVGHLAAGMAHEIGNPLGAVVGYLGLLRTELSPGPEQEIAARALVETERIERLVRELLEYAAPAGGEVQTFDPVAVLAEACRMLTHQGVFEGLFLEDQLPTALPSTRMSRHRLVQVFVNLLLNARDACAPGGTISLTAGTQGGEFGLTVADNGTGIPPEVLVHIFEPFYTTKASGRGRGLGLAVCQRFIGDAGGRIEVRSSPGQGSEFTVWLKKVEAAAHEG